MDKSNPLCDDRKRSAAGAAAQSPMLCGERKILDRLSRSFSLERSESEWLLTLLGADELRYIFEGRRDGGVNG